MKNEFEEMKKEFMSVKNGHEWNAFKKKYPHYTFEDVDKEMSEHFNELIRSVATKEMLDNPHIHYEVRKK
ncbi:MAG: hypothetical protein Q4D45_10395 [Lachnospiraceae bacterium]|nr:hypothetical protein [Lachnospiraceae bacterium]